MKTIIKSFMAGVSISLGGFVFLSSDVKIIGALLFSIGLLLVCTMNYNLFTGKICYLGKSVHFPNVVVIWIFNFVGTFLMGLLTRFVKPELITRAQAICNTKMQEEPIVVFILGMLCNILIFFAVHEYKNNTHELGKYLMIVVCIVVFIMSGFEHCIANMYYFSVAGMKITYLMFLNINTFGNALGGILAYRLTEWSN